MTRHGQCHPEWCTCEQTERRGNNEVVVGERSTLKPLPAQFYPFGMPGSHKFLRQSYMSNREIYYEFRICFLVWKGELTTT